MSWTQILYFPHVRITQPSGFDYGTDLTERSPRKLETALSELLQLPEGSKMVLSFAPRVGVGVGKGLHFGDICCLVIGPDPRECDWAWERCLNLALLRAGLRAANLCCFCTCSKECWWFLRFVSHEFKQNSPWGTVGCHTAT